MQIIRKNHVLSLINETAKNFDYNTKVHKNIFEEDKTNSKEYITFQNKSGATRRQSRQVKTVPKKGGYEKLNFNIDFQMPYREYVGGSDNLVKALQSQYRINEKEAMKKINDMRKIINYQETAEEKREVAQEIFKEYQLILNDILYNELISADAGSDNLVKALITNYRINANEASKLAYEMRAMFRNNEEPDKIFEKYGLKKYSPNDKVYNELITPEKINKSVALYEKGKISGNPIAWLHTDTTTNVQDVLVPICFHYKVPEIEGFTGFSTNKGKIYKPGDTLSIEDFENIKNDIDEDVYENLENFLNVIVDGEEFKKNNKEILINLAKITNLNPSIIACKGYVRPEFAPQTMDAKVIAKFSGYALYQKIVDKKYIRDPKKIFSFIESMRDDVVNGTDPEEVLYENGIFPRGERIPGNIILELRGISIGHSITGNRAKLAELLKRKLNRILRLNFGVSPRDAKTSDNTTFETPTSVKNMEIFDKKALPLIVISTKYTNKDLGLNNDSISVEGQSFNDYQTIYEFLEKVVGIKVGLEPTDYQRRLFSKNLRWDETRASRKEKLGRTPTYDLKKLGISNENINVRVTLNWKIDGVRVEDKFNWTFTVKVKVGTKGENEYKIDSLTPVQNFNEKLGKYFNDIIVKTVSTPARKKNPYSETSDGNTILDDKSVLRGLRDVITEMMKEIDTKFNPEEAFLNIADVTQDRLQEKREVLTKYLINKIINEIKNSR